MDALYVVPATTKLKIIQGVRKLVDLKKHENSKSTTMEIFNDFNTSVAKALEEIDKDWRSYKGLIVCGTHNQQNVEALIERIRKAREEQTPTLLICAGYQLGFIEYCRSIIGIKDA